MKTLTATEAARNFSRVLDMLEHGSEEIVVVRNNHPVAKLVPAAPRLTAREELGDLHKILPDAEGACWLKNARKMGRSLRRKLRESWV